MRPSDKILNDDLERAGLHDMAMRARRGEWNDYFGKHACNMLHLSEMLKARLRKREKEKDFKSAAVITEMLLAILDGKYDASAEEAAEWAEANEKDILNIMGKPGVQEALDKLKSVLATEAAQSKMDEISKAYVKDVLKSDE